MEQQTQQKLYGIHELAVRWGVSRDTVRKLVADQELRSVTIATRRMIPLAEVQRAELLGVGRARKKRTDADAQQV
jgi:excisionase family DNA binding protein